jgi:hypothetical protein
MVLVINTKTMQYWMAFTSTVAQPFQYSLF